MQNINLIGMCSNKILKVGLDFMEFQKQKHIISSKPIL